MNRVTDSQFRKLEVGVRSPAEALGLLSDSLGDSGQVRSRQTANRPDSATTESTEELLRKAVLALPVAVLPRRRRFSPHYLYFLRAANGLVKVGHTGDLRTRIGGLRVGSPIPLDLIGFAPIGSKWFERHAHAYLEGTESHGEWFHPSERFLNLLKVSQGRAWIRLTRRHSSCVARGVVQDLELLVERSVSRRAALTAEAAS